MTMTNVLVTLAVITGVGAAMRYDMKSSLNMLSRNAKHVKAWMESGAAAASHELAKSSSSSSSSSTAESIGKAAAAAKPQPPPSKST